MEPFNNQITDYEEENYISIIDRKKIKEQKLVEESDNKLTECLFSDNPYTIEKTNINIKKIGENKFISIVSKKLKPIVRPIVKPVVKPKNNEDNHYDLNDYSYDYCDNFDIEDKYFK